MEIKKNYNENTLGNVMKEQKNAEDLIREILSKICPMHGTQGNIEIKQNGEITVSACCEDSHSLIKNIIYSFKQNTSKT
jgi:hypothetical protein